MKIVSTITTIFLVISYIECQVRMVVTIFAEGAKAPTSHIDSNRLDLFKESWPVNGVLTGVGMRMNYLLGKKEKERYNHLISSQYRRKDVFVRSGPQNSTMMATNSYLQGLFETGNGHILVPEQREIAYPPMDHFGEFNPSTFGNGALPNRDQVLPVEPFDQLDKKYFFLTLGDGRCGPLMDKWDDNKSRREVKDWIKNFVAKYGERLTKVLNINDVRDLNDYYYLSAVMETFIADYTEGKVLRRFNENGIDLREFNTTAYEFLNLEQYEVKNGYNSDGMLPNATMSAFSDEMLFWFNNRINADQQNLENKAYSRPRMVIFGANLNTVSSIVAFIAREKGTDLIPVGLASSINFELVFDPINSTSIEESYRVNARLDGSILFTFGYNEFKQMLGKVWSEEDVRKKCANNLLERYGYKNATIVLGVLLGVAVILLILLIFTYYRSKSGSSTSSKVEEKSKVNNTENKKTHEDKKDDRKEQHDLEVKDDKQEKVENQNQDNKNEIVKDEVKDDVKDEVKDGEHVNENGDKVLN